MENMVKKRIFVWLHMNIFCKLSIKEAFCNNKNSLIFLIKSLNKPWWKNLQIKS